MAPRAPKREVTIALIGLAGVLVTGTLSNWDKLFPRANVVEAAYTGYRPTGEFETEMRYFFEVSGSRRTLESMQEQLLSAARGQLLTEHPEDAKDIEAFFKTAKQEMPSVDSILKLLMPLYQKHFALAEIQELNKFYSTEVMQTMTKRMPMLMQEAAPLQMKMMQEVTERLDQQLAKVIADK